MKILLVAATENELSPFIQKLGTVNASGEYHYKGHTIHLLITGAGMVQMAWAMGQAIPVKKYDLAINAGIAGTFNEKIKLGNIVLVKEDIFAELGAEDGETFIPGEELDINLTSRFVNTVTITSSVLDSIRKVTAITVNRVHGNEGSIQAVSKRLNPDIESMEGAAFFYCCAKAKLPCLQIRAISNKVEKRNKNNWDVPLAVKNLNESLLSILNSLS